MTRRRRSRERHGIMALTRFCTMPEAAEASMPSRRHGRACIFERRLTGLAVRVIETGPPPRWPSLRRPRGPASADPSV